MRTHLKEILAEKIRPSDLKLIHRSYDVVGDVAILRVPKAVERRDHEVAEAVMKINQHVTTVLRQASPIKGHYRLRGLDWVAGEKRRETVHKEHDCLFRVDLSRCYFSPRLSYERQRIAQQVRRDEVVVNMFSGVGCYSIAIAKISGAKRVYSIDVNPVAIEYQRKNVRMNGVEDIVKPMLGDAATIIKTRLRNIADRILMPLPQKAFEHLDYAVIALSQGEGYIHYYDFVRAGRNEKPIEKIENKVSKKMDYLDLDYGISFARIVRTVGPRRFQVVLDLLVHEKS